MKIEQANKLINKHENEDIPKINSQLEQNDKHIITKDFIDVTNPPNGFLPLIQGYNNLETKQLNSERLQALLDGIGRTNKRKFYFPKNVFEFSKGVEINFRNVVFIGDGNVTTDKGGSELVFYGDEDFITLGNKITEDKYVENLYNGIDGFSVNNILIRHGNPQTNLNNRSLEKYKSGVKAIADWCGGSVYLFKTTIKNFEYGFYGVQSDFNHFDRANFIQNKTGIYASVRSDQWVMVRPDFTACDCGLFNDGALNCTLYSPNFNQSGSGDNYGGDSDVKVTGGSTFIQSPWVEHYSRRSDESIVFCRVGIDNQIAVGEIPLPNVKIDFPHITAGTKHIFLFNKGFCEITNATDISSNSSLVSIAQKEGSDEGIFNANLNDGRFGDNRIFKYGQSSSNARLSVLSSEYGQTRFYSLINRLYLNNPQNSNSNLLIEPNDKGVKIKVGDRDIFNVTKLTKEHGEKPTTGTHQKGDYCKNLNPTELGNSGSKYVIKGWICVADGTPGTWLEDRCLTGN